MGGPAVSRADGAIGGTVAQEWRVAFELGPTPSRPSVDILVLAPQAI